MGPGQRTMAVPMRRQPGCVIRRAGSNRSEMAADDDSAGASVKAATTATSHRMPAGNAQALEIRQAG